MKQIACSAMGGPASCTETISGNTAEETMTTAWKHVEKDHPDLAKQIQGNPKEVNDKWTADFKTQWDSLPETGK